MKDKQSIRYLGFECIDDGGRRLGFSVDPPAGDAVEVHIDIAGPHFAGDDRILIQEAAGIGSMKIRELCEQGEITRTIDVDLTDSDISRLRQVAAVSGKHRRGMSGRSKQEGARRG